MTVAIVIFTQVGSVRLHRSVSFPGTRAGTKPSATTARRAHKSTDVLPVNLL